MLDYCIEWLGLLFRWLHIITGAAWIGASFYFNWLNHSLRPPEEEKERISGELFAVHGGHFYQVNKYDGAPETLPKTLHWFKWEAYFTWITGIALLMIVYYWNARLYLIDSEVYDFTPLGAVSTGIGFLIGGWIIYDQLCKSALIKSPKVFTFLGISLLVGAAFALSQLFGGRAAYIHFGAMLGTMMAANVFFVIIPNQRIMVDAMIAGETPDTSLGDAGALRSLHNNYFTLPVLFIMISNHFPQTFGHQWNWAVLVALSLIGVTARHYFNLKHKGKEQPWLLPAAALGMIALAVAIQPRSTYQNGHIAHSGSQPPSVQFSEIMPILEKRCQPCHASKPNFMGFSEPPQGIIYEDPKVIQALAPKIKIQAVDQHIMPPGNLTKITDEERALLGQWIEAGAPID